MLLVFPILRIVTDLTPPRGLRPPTKEPEMIITTKFSCGDVIYVVGRFDIRSSQFCISPAMLIGQIRIKHTDSPGIPGEDTFDNYMPQSDYEESYMCVESGIGSGSIFHSPDAFSTREEAQAEADKRNAEETSDET